MKVYTDLLPYQEKAVEKLSKITVGALYMEMGTGKTRTALELILQRLNTNKVDRVLWLCPCNIKRDIARNIAEHSDLCDTGLLDIVGIETLSSSVRECSRLLDLVTKNRVYLIVDESSLIKNHKALRSIHIGQLADHCRYKLILNGTPITRSEEDLYGQWKILDWRILGYRSFYSFAANHLEYDDKGRVRRTLNTDYLAEKIAPYTYQIRKDECFTLPEKIYRQAGFRMTPEQEENYSYVVDRLLLDMDEMSSESIYQLFGALQSIISGFRVTVDQRKRTSRAPMFDNPEDNPRIEELLYQMRLLDDKVLVFCHYTEEIKDVMSVLTKNGISCVSFYGDMSRKARDKALDEFRGDTKVMVANKSCGAYGLNLQFCHNVVFYSHDWDWGTRAQAEDRVHRLGQTEKVTIIDLECVYSIDTRILDCLSRKEGLSNAFKKDVSNIQKTKLLDFVRGKKNEKDIPAEKRPGGVL